MLPLFVPSTAAAGPLLYYASSDPRILWVPVVASYILFPLLGLAPGKDPSIPPEAEA